MLTRPFYRVGCEESSRYRGIRRVRSQELLQSPPKRDKQESVIPCPTGPYSTIRDLLLRRMHGGSRENDGQ